ncbi:hypothetical protein LTR78_010500 [Recurvomyces mirabilis]|uniref:Uncharacterized protein n=1 Tax=Recurvomyces mirabilis TaxID=574656 RepID=A0AAE0WHY6_9PEZI|nr:hypothetical protein LTR78_010500 [Recurvomyces mirabilis]KAK5151683.1 hypothetical protein LTS14_009170 [Recurvomyces mirabilis]
MFGMPGVGLPYRNRKDVARAQNFRGWTRRHPARSTEEMWTPMSGAMPWPRSMYGAGASVPNYDRFEELEEVPIRHPLSASGMAFRSPKHRGGSGHNLIAFDKAAEALYEALQYAVKHCKAIKEQFENEVIQSSIVQWVPPNMMIALWTMKIDWDGSNAATQDGAAAQQPHAGVATYRDMKSLLEAMKDMQMCELPRLGDLNGSEVRLSPEILRNTINKLQVTLHGVEEMMQSVRKDRLLMDALIKDLESTVQLLMDVEELWTSRPRPAGPRARGGREDEYRWRRYDDD